MGNRLLEKLQSGGHAFGTFAELGGANSIEAVGASGIDFVIIDNEHGMFDVESSADMIRACEKTGMASLCRVREISRPAVMKLLDVGADGVIIPNVETVEQVKELVNYAKYAPLGKRGFCATRKDGWGYAYPATEGFAAQMEYWNRETLLIPQCETAGSLEHIEEITAIDGVDGIMIGPFDLSISMGMAGQFDDPVFKAAIARILKACKSAGKYSMIFTAEEDKIKTYYEQGFDIVCYSFDAGAIIEYFRAIMKRIS